MVTNGENSGPFSGVISLLALPFSTVALVEEDSTKP